MSASISTILRSLEQLPEPVRVAGTTPPSRAAILARWCRSVNSPCVVICPDADAASTLAEDIEAFGRISEDYRVSVRLMPGWEQSPYSSIAPSLRVRLERIATLSEMREGQGPLLILTTLAAASQSTIPPSCLSEQTIQLQLGKSVGSREQLVRRLVEAGYLQMDPVEDPGTFAVRGDIIDVFAPSRANPVRVELFGDEVERLREFDPASQRTLSAPEAELREVAFSPAREVLINSFTLPALRRRLKARADELGIPRPVRDPVLESVAEGLYPDHSDGWGPFAYETPATFWDHLKAVTSPAAWPIAWVDELSILQAWDEHLKEQSERAPEAASSGIIMPAPDELYPMSSELDRQVRGASRLYLDKVELATLQSLPNPQDDPREVPGEADSISSRLRVVVKDNDDIAAVKRHSFEELDSKFRLWIKQGFSMVALASTQSQLERVRYLLEERDIPCRKSGEPAPSVVTLVIGSISCGMRWPAEGLILLTDSELLGARHVVKQKRSRTSESASAARDWSGLQALSDLAIGDLVVHVEHGIGRYHGLVRLDLTGAPSDFLVLEYAGRDKLYLPVYRLNVIQKYVGSGESANLDRLGSQQFARTKERVRSEVKKLAIDLVQLYAERSVREGLRLSPRDSSFSEFEAQFPFDETPDQLRAIDETLSDLESGKVMDRLICGDVGYGKTEVAIRAAFKAVSDGKQVAVLVPTTVLAHQHEQSFKTRLKDYPIVVESVSRFKSAKEQKEVLKATVEGKVDVLIGTHRLLSKDVSFRDLGLIIVDEEQRFGVEHKERLKTLRVNTHVLTLTATPIPRTLHMALAGLREISLINTPPVDRLPIRTYVSRFDEPLIQRAIEFELNRGGQVFFVHNRVQSIHEIANRIRELVPKARITIAHGQMSERELEKAMMTFYARQANVLVSTAIIESGLDVPSANTIIVNRADAFGLSQLYQIRGRVGRGQERAYAYLLLPAEGAISEDAKKRLEVIQRFVELGSGFSVANHDLEIRGGGDLLGAQQSGHIAAVGFDLYTELLEEAIQELRGKAPDEEASRREPEIKAPFPAFLPEEYVPDVHQRLSLYRRLSGAKEEAELLALEEELRDRFGELPEESQNLLWMIRIKQGLKKMGIDTLVVGPEKISLQPGAGSKLDPIRAIALYSSDRHKYQLTPDSKFVARIATGSLRDLHFALEGLFKELTPRTT